MPRFTWLFEEADVPLRDGALPPEAAGTLRRWFTMRADQPVALFANDAGVAFVRPGPDGRFPVDGTPVVDIETLKAGRDRTRLRLVAPSADMTALVRYLQKLGTNRGAWRDVFEPQNVAVVGTGIPATEANLELGREVFEAHCVGCHGDRGDGTGPAATFLSPLPRD